MEKLRLSDNSFLYTGPIPAHASPSVQQLLTLKPDDVGKVVIAGREIPTPRYVSHYIRPYAYTGLVHAAQPLPSLLQPLLDWATTILATIEDGKWKTYRFNQALVNYYMDGMHYIGRHSDDERQLLPDSPVFSASFGQERCFRIREKKTRHIVSDISMANGTVIVMCGKMQKEYTHEVPKVTGEKGRVMGPRVNVTFRIFK